MPASRTRTKLVERLRRRLLARGWPRFQMTLVVLGTGAVGFVASALLLRVGLDRMWIRYPAAIGIACLAFLTLLRIWISFHRKMDASLPDLDLSDLIDASSNALPHRPSGVSVPSDSQMEPSDGASAVAESVGISLDLDELLLVLIPIAITILALVASLYVIITAPAFFAELLVDGVLVGGLYRRLRRLERRSWYATGLRRTWWMFLGIAVLFGVGGFVIQTLEPSIRSIGDISRVVFDGAAPEP